METSFPEDSLFIKNESRQRRWAIPYHPEAVNTRGNVLLGGNIQHIRGKTVLDLGCHFGTWSWLALQLGAKQVEGIDSSPSLIEKADELFIHYRVTKETYRFKVGNVLEVLAAKPDKSVDTILCLGLLYYLPDPYTFLKAMKRVAREAIILDTFTATYCAVQGKDSKDILAKTTPDTFDLPLLFHILTQVDKQGYDITHTLKKGKKELSFLTCPTVSLLRLYFDSLGLTHHKLDWSDYLQSPNKTWQDLISREGKESSHWTDVYSCDMRASYLLQPS